MKLSRCWNGFLRFLFWLRNVEARCSGVLLDVTFACVTVDGSDGVYGPGSARTMPCRPRHGQCWKHNENLVILKGLAGPCWYLYIEYRLYRFSIVATVLLSYFWPWRLSFFFWFWMILDAGWTNSWDSAAELPQQLSLPCCASPTIAMSHLELEAGSDQSSDQDGLFCTKMDVSSFVPVEFRLVGSKYNSTIDILVTYQQSFLETNFFDRRPCWRDLAQPSGPRRLSWRPLPWWRALWDSLFGGVNGARCQRRPLSKPLGRVGVLVSLVVRGLGPISYTH